MFNYIKSEFYRIRHTRAVYIFTGVLCSLVLAFNIGMAIMNDMDAYFRYGTFRFSLNSFTAQPKVYLYMAGLVPALFFLVDKKSGALQNTIAYGIPREKVVLGKSIVCFVTALCVMITTLVFYVGSAFLFLKTPEWLPLIELLSGIGALMPTAIASMLLVIVLSMVLENETHVIVVWLVIVSIIPSVIQVIGLKVDVILQIARWLPFAAYTNEIVIHLNSYDCIWHTTEGLIRCLLSGVIGITGIMALGIPRIKKQDL